MGGQGPEKGGSEEREWSRSLLVGGQSWGLKGQRREGDRAGVERAGEGGEAGWLSGSMWVVGR